MSPHLSSRAFVRLRLPLLLLGVFWLTAAIRATGADSELKLVLILSRHGVRAPLAAQHTYDRFAAQPFAKWTTPAGELTPHGRRQMELMGDYYRAQLLASGLLSGDAHNDSAQVYLRANNEQRTIESARALGASLLPGETVSVRARPAGEADPIFRPAKVPLGRIDRDRAVAAVLGRLGGDLTATVASQPAAFTTLNQILIGDATLPAGKSTLASEPTIIVPGQGEDVIALRGPLNLAASLTDLFMLQYSEGFPMADVGWGRISRTQLTELLAVHALYYDLRAATFEIAQVQMSNLARHIGDTLLQTANSRAHTGAFGAPGQQVVVLVGHETTQIGLAGLLGLEWRLPGTQQNPALLGGALVFELRQRTADRAWLVRVRYVAPTMEQTRELTPLTADNPPARAPIFLQGISAATPGYDAPLADFEALLQRVIDPQFVTPSAD